MALQMGARADLAAAFESTYGTAPGSGWNRIPFVSSTLGAEQELLASDVLGVGRDPVAPVLGAESADGELTVPFDADAFGIWLKACFGDPVTSGTGPYVHEFASGAWDLPSLSIEVAMPQVPRFALYTGCVVDNLSLSLQRSGLMSASLGLIAQGETVGSSSAAVSPADVGLRRFSSFAASVTRDGVEIGTLVSAEIEYSNNLDRVEVIRGDGRIAGALPGQASLSGRLTMRLADLAMIQQAISGAPCELVASWNQAADAAISWTAHAVYLSRPRVPVEGPNGVQVTFDFQAARGGAQNRLCTVELTNNIGAY